MSDDAKWDSEKREIFAVYNKEDKNEVSGSDFRDILTSLSIALTDDQCTQLEKQIDVEHHGVLNYESFSMYVDKALNLSQRDAGIAQAFEIFCDNDGFIQLETFERIMTTMGKNKLSKDDMKTILTDAGFDRKTQNTIHYSKILELVQKSVI